MAVVAPGISLHSADFASAAVSEAGHKGLVDAAKALAMTVADLISEPETIAKVKKEFSD